MERESQQRLDIMRCSGPGERLLASVLSCLVLKVKPRYRTAAALYEGLLVGQPGLVPSDGDQTAVIGEEVKTVCTPDRPTSTVGVGEPPHHVPGLRVPHLDTSIIARRQEPVTSIVEVNVSDAQLVTNISSDTSAFVVNFPQLDFVVIAS